MYKDKEQMLDDQILSEFLDNAVLKARERITQEGRLSTEDAIPLMLKSQFNHIAHLEQEMVTKKELQEQLFGLQTKFDGRMDKLDGRMDGLQTKLNGRMDGLQTKINGRMDSLQYELNGRIDGLQIEFHGMRDQFSMFKWIIMLGFTFLSALQIYLAVIK